MSVCMLMSLIKCIYTWEVKIAIVVDSFKLWELTYTMKKIILVGRTGKHYYRQVGATPLAAVSHSLSIQWSVSHHRSNAYIHPIFCNLCKKGGVWHISDTQHFIYTSLLC